MQKYLILLSLMIMLTFMMKEVNGKLDKLILRNLIINDTIKKQNKKIQIKLSIEKLILEKIKECEEITGIKLENFKSIDEEYVKEFKDLFKSKILASDLIIENILISFKDLEYENIYEEQSFYILFKDKDLPGEKEKMAMKIDFSKDIEEKQFLEFIKVNKMGKTEDGFSLVEIIFSVLILAMISIFLIRITTNYLEKTYIDIDQVQIEDEVVNFNYFFKDNIESMSRIKKIETNSDENKYINDKKRIHLDSVVFCNDHFKGRIKENNLFTLKVKKKIKNGKVLKGLNFSKKDIDISKPKVEVMSYIADDIYLEPIPRQANFKYAKGVKIIFVLGDQCIEKSAFFLNKRSGNI